jgi:Ca2+-binding EF-hand superfamily protein
MRPWFLISGALLLVLCLAHIIPAADEGAEDKGQPTADDVQDFVLLADTRPVLVRLHVRIDSEPLEAVWNAFMQQLFRSLDVNGDGVLDEKELERVPSVDLLLARGGVGFGLPVEKVTARALVEKNQGRKVTAADLAAYYRQNGLAPLQVRVGPTPVTLPPQLNRLPLQMPGAMAPPAVLDPVNRGLPREPSAGARIAQAVFDLLDSNKDGKLTREELAAAPAALRRADGNDDEVVTVQELASYSAAHQLASASNSDPLILVQSDEPADELVRRLLDRYGPKTDKPEDKKITQKDLGIEGATFALLDTDKDGQLDKEELAHFARRPPDLELTVRLSAGGREAQIELNTEQSSLPEARAKDGAVTVNLGAITLRLRPSDDVVRPLGLERWLQGRGMFDSLDEKRKGHVVEEDTLRPGSPGMFRGHFKLMDRDGDGKVTERELLAYLQEMSSLQARATASCVSLVFIEEGRGLFDLLDTDHDGRLSVHEMQQAPRLLERFDKDGKGYITASAVPRHCQLLVRRGPAAGAGYSAQGYNGRYVYTEIGEEDPPPAPVPKAGPRWFRMMDQNGDGFISVREFLGSTELFRKIDTDGDGLISLEEAIKADALVRKSQ